MSGHTHYAENNTYDSHYEHVHGAACGAWWHSTINTDGTPNGYAIYKVKGATIDNWVYKATGFDPDTPLPRQRHLHGRVYAFVPVLLQG